MKNVLVILSFCLFYLNSAEAQFGKKLLDKAKETISAESGGDLDVAGGLKSALELGTKESVKNLAKENGYFDSPYKILIPEEARKVTDKIKILPGFENVEKDLIQKMNQAAEIAVEKATPIFLDAIKNMSFKDAMNILMGEENAATTYLDGQSRTKLYAEFMPIIQRSLDEVNAREYWTKAVGAYNKIPLTKKLNPELDDHVNNKTMDGIFALISKKEKDIRSDVSLRTTPLLKDVFAKQDKN